MKSGTRLLLNIYGDFVFIDPDNVLTSYKKEDDLWAVEIIDLRDSEYSVKDQSPRSYVVAYFNAEEDARLFSHQLLDTILEISFPKKSCLYLDISEEVKKFKKRGKEYLKMQKVFEDALIPNDEMEEEYEEKYFNEFKERLEKVLKVFCEVEKIKGQEYFYIPIFGNLHLYLTKDHIIDDIDFFIEYGDFMHGIAEGLLYIPENVIENEKIVKKLMFVSSGKDGEHNVLNILKNEKYLAWKEKEYRVFYVTVFITSEYEVKGIPLDNEGEIKINNITFKLSHKSDKNSQ